MDRTTRSTCPYCGVGCGVLIDTTQTPEGARITGVRGDPDHPANTGRLCTKGATLHLTATPMVRQHQRLLQPAWREARGAPLEPVGWDMAVQQVADRVVMLYPRARLDPADPQVIYDGPADGLATSGDQRVRQFVLGEAGERLTEMHKESGETG